MSAYGQQASTPLGVGWVAMGTQDPAVIDPLTAGNALEEARAQVRTAEAELRRAQERHASAVARLAALEQDAA